MSNLIGIDHQASQTRETKEREEGSDKRGAFDAQVTITSPGEGVYHPVDAIGGRAPICAWATTNTVGLFRGIIVAGKIYAPSVSPPTDYQNDGELAVEDPPNSGNWYFSYLPGADFDVPPKENQLAVWLSLDGGTTWVDRDVNTFWGYPWFGSDCDEPPPFRAFSGRKMGTCHCGHKPPVLTLAPQHWSLKVAGFSGENSKCNGRYLLELSKVDIKGNTCTWQCNAFEKHPKVELSCECLRPLTYRLKFHVSSKSSIEYTCPASAWNPHAANMLFASKKSGPRALKMKPGKAQKG